MGAAQCLSESQEAREMRQAYLRALPVFIVGIGVAMVMLVVERMAGERPPPSGVGRSF